MALWPPNDYRNAGVDHGRSPELVANALSQAHLVQTQGLPAILSLRHLAHMVDVPYRRLRSIVSRRVDPYRTFQISKRSGGYRTICVPTPLLLALQRWIHLRLLLRHPVHPASRAYASGSSVRECARMHAPARWLCKVDIRQFFESITEIQAYHVFEGMGYSPLVAFELARLCTRCPPLRSAYKSPVWRIWPGRHSTIEGYCSGPTDL